MPEPAAKPVHPRAAGRSALRVVLFGRAHAGKSSLLGALWQAARTQESVLKGKLTDLSQGLAELQRRAYQDAMQPTTGEIVPYPVAYQPSQGRPVEAVLFDCDGDKVNDLLERRRLVDSDGGQGSLPRAILDADALALVVDASAEPAHVDADFALFERFLRLLEQTRGRLTEVSGQPVFLVLTKGDRLVASPGAAKALTFADWVNRMEEKKLKVAERFREFLARSRGQEPAAFGRLDLRQVWATAIKRPALADRPAESNEPYGVAELFRQCLGDASNFRQQRTRSNWRLFGLVAGGVGALGLLAAAVVGLLYVTRPPPRPGALEVQVDHYLAREQERNAADRYRNLRQQIIELEGWTNDPAFAKLPEAKQDQLRRRLAELKAYEEFATTLGQIADPREAQSLQQLQEIENALAAVKVPPQYQDPWSRTEAGRRYGEMLDDAAALHAAAAVVQGWYEKLARDGRLVLSSASKPNLPGRAKRVLDEAAAPPFPENEPDRPLPGARLATYASVFAFAGVKEAQGRWEEVRKKLEPAARLDTP